MLGVVHRAVLKKGPPQFWKYFTVVDNLARTRSSDRHRLQLRTYRDDKHLDIMSRSVLGLVNVYNLLSAALVESASEVKDFQTQLQALVLTQLQRGKEDWSRLLSPRLCSWERSLSELRDWSNKEAERS